MITDKIIIQGLAIEAIIGILPHERTQKQPLIIDLEFCIDAKKAAKNDNIKDAVDYAVIAKFITDFISKSEFNLLETLIETVANLLHEKFKINWLMLKIDKPRAIPNAKQTAIQIERRWK